MIGDDINEKDFISYHSHPKKINIRDYQEMEEYSFYSNKDFLITIDNHSYDLQSYFEKIYSYQKENNDLDAYLEDNCIIVLEENMILYITDLQLDYRNNYITLDGYILYK